MKLYVIIIMILFWSVSKSDNYSLVGLVPSSFPVDFSLFTKGGYHFVAFYDTAHVMTVGKKEVGSNNWEYKKMDSKVGWDSHNYVTLYVDDSGYIHLSGNMHSNFLQYYRSERPWDISSLKEFVMVGTEEDVTTYPVFMEGPNNSIIYHYRYGRSGNGYEVFNVYDIKSKSWRRLLDCPLIDGEGKMNAYMQGPLLGPDGFYHMIWVWRDSPDCSTNHTLSYARSRDFVNWESIEGVSVDLPITLSDECLVVDATPVKGGLLNIGIKLGFVFENEAVIGYHKYDKNGNTQLYLCFFSNEGWVSKQLTDWNYRWDFKGMHSIEEELVIDSPRILGDSIISFCYNHKYYGKGRILLDSYFNKREDVRKVDVYDELTVHRVLDSGEPDRFYLEWKTLPANRDSKREGVLPSPAELRLYEIK